MHVFGTVMSQSNEGVLVDLWCPEEPCLTQRTIVTQKDIGRAIEALLRECLDRSFGLENLVSIKLLTSNV